MRLPFRLRDNWVDEINAEYVRRCGLESGRVKDLPKNQQAHQYDMILIKTVQEAHWWDGPGRLLWTLFATIGGPLSFEWFNFLGNSLGWLNGNGWGAIENSLPAGAQEIYHPAGWFAFGLLGFAAGIARHRNTPGPLPNVDKMPQLGPEKNVITNPRDRNF